jgi:Rrf2 family protein
MQITHQADYAIRAIYYLACLEHNQKVPTVKIADEYKIPASFLTKIISQLSIAGLIHTSRGARGGVSLARPAEMISLLDVLEAIDGPVALNECVGDKESCPFSNECVLHQFWMETSEELVNRLRSTTYDKLVQKGSLNLGLT